MRSEPSNRGGSIEVTAVRHLCGCLFFLVGLFATACSASAAQYVGGSAAQAIYLAWTVDSAGHLQGQAQVVSIGSNNPANLQRISASFTGTRDGSEISLAFGILSNFSGQTWTGEIDGRDLTLNLPNGAEIHFHLGTHAEFATRVAALSETANNAIVLRGVTSALDSSYAEVLRTERGVKDTLAALQAHFPSPRPDRAHTMVAGLDKAIVVEQRDLEKEKAMGAGSLTCAEKGSIQAQAGIVEADYGSFEAADGATLSARNEIERELDFMPRGLADFRAAVQTYNVRVEDYNLATHQHRYSLVTLALVDQLTHRLDPIVLQYRKRFQLVLGERSDDLAQSKAIEQEAIDFEKSLTCSN